MQRNHVPWELQLGFLCLLSGLTSCIGLLRKISLPCAADGNLCSSPARKAHFPAGAPFRTGKLEGGGSSSPLVLQGSSSAFNLLGYLSALEDSKHRLGNPEGKPFYYVSQWKICQCVRLVHVAETAFLIKTIVLNGNLEAGIFFLKSQKTKTKQKNKPHHWNVREEITRNHPSNTDVPAQ